MIELKITGPDITSLVDFFKSYTAFTELRYWNQWNLAPDTGDENFSKLYTFIYTHFMNIINSDLTVSVMVEFKSKSESKITIVSSGGKKGVLQFDNGAEDQCEQRIFKDLRSSANFDWIVADNSILEF